MHLSKKRSIFLLILYIIFIFFLTFIARDLSNSLKELNILKGFITFLFISFFIIIGIILFFKKIILNKKQIFFLLSLSFITILLIFQLKIPEERFHFIEFGILTILIKNTIFRKSNTNFEIQYFISVLFSFSIGVLDEILQYFLPNRYFDIKDIIINLIASLLPIIYFEIIYNKLKITKRIMGYNNKKNIS